MAPLPASRGYAICTSPRSGSNFLCQHLSASGVLGQPLEYFNWRGRRVFENPAYPDDIPGQVEQILSVGATSNGIYAFKIFAHQHDWISGEISWFDALPELRLVLLTRRNVLAQAISWARALQTGQYRASQIAICEPVFDPDLIATQLRAIVVETARWELFFARTGIQPLRLIYEDFVDAPRSAVQAVASFMGVSLPRAESEEVGVTIRQQRDYLNREWAERFRTERGNCNTMDQL
ncbi:hypothetical protein GA830_12750 [Mesorhizobium sp. NBSH29]|uniref:Stf0 family sulfotransferase n=1 Tax=Mesorhizobium sp. NBSH29 TaxID=2654249 RepID=UPI00189698EC|nr:Stf0 family sulfotransferase [Mesorhizobium sp. NBSH29]QPC87518.1 hypothetical protein GA830_12750 [Mesorhizobium sp. NBSH29]